MNPEHIALINTLAFVLEKVGSWPIGMVMLFAVVGPWVGMFVIARGQEKRFEAVARMYESNAKLVEGYEDVARNLQDLVIMNTQAMTEVREAAEHNLYCPVVRKNTHQTEAGE